MTDDLRNTNVSPDTLPLVNYRATQLQNPKTAPASGASLSTLPGELLSEILQLAMRSEKAVCIWLFPGIIHSASLENNNPGVTLAPPYLPRSMFGEHERPLSDWRCVTGTCRRFRDYGIPAFFREKRFVIPRRLFPVLGSADAWHMGKFGLWKNDHGRPLNFMECIRHVILPCFRADLCRMDELPRDVLTSLRTITLWVCHDLFFSETQREVEKVARVHGDVLKGVDVKFERFRITLKGFPFQPSWQTDESGRERYAYNDLNNYNDLNRYLYGAD